MALRYEADRLTLYWIQDGMKVSVNFNDWTYSIVSQVHANQVDAARENRMRLDHYMTKLQTAQINEDAARPYPPSLLDQPLMVIVPDPVMDEFGNVTAAEQTEGPWVPALPLLRLKNKLK